MVCADYCLAILLLYSIDVIMPVSFLVILVDENVCVLCKCSHCLSHHNSVMCFFPKKFFKKKGLVILGKFG